MTYIELHCKTNFSFLQGASHTEELVYRAAELGYAGLAVTDVNSLAGVVRAHAAAKAVGLKLIVGAEITPLDAPPVLLWATDRAAYGRLARLITRWIDLTALLRVVSGAWESDMIALIAASAELGIEYREGTFAAWMPWPEKEVAGAPIIHYCQPVLDGDGNELWFKGSYRPWETIHVDPEAAALPYCTDLLRIIQEYTATRA